MEQPSGGLRLGTEARQESLVGEGDVTEQLQRHVPAVRRSDGLPNLSHPALAEQAHQAVFADAGPGRKSLALSLFAFRQAPARVRDVEERRRLRPLGWGCDILVPA